MINILLSISCVAGYNLDVVRALPLKGPINSSFGFSVTQWKRSEPATLHNGVLVVGSPRAVEYQGTRGAVYFCSAHNGSCHATQDAATHALLDYTKHTLRVLPSTLRQTVTSGFGEHVYASRRSPYLLLCSPRFPINLRIPGLAERKQGNIQPRGGCVRFGGDTGSIAIVPVKEHTFLLTDAAGKRSLIQNSNRYTGFSEVGFCSALTEDKIFLGSPGAFYGQGTVFSGDARSVDQLLKSHKTAAENIPDYPNEFWAIVIGRLDGATDILAASAPNALEKMTGKISMYAMTGPDGSLVKQSARGSLKMEGRETGGMYGYSLAAGDYDGDGVDDLAAGTPYLTDEITGLASGAVSVHYGPLAQRVTRESLVVSSPGQGGQFGMAAACPGDLDGDGYADLAVGAPDDGSGKVFIYNGSPEGLMQMPSQILVGSTLLPGLIDQGRFGFSVSGGHDLDGNGAPDLIIGAVGASRAVYVRSAPVLTVVGNVWFDPDKVTLGNVTCPITNVYYTCFKLVHNLRYNSTLFTEDIEVDLNMAVDERHRQKRTLFYAVADKYYSTTLNITHVSKSPKEETYPVYLVNNPRPSEKELVKASIQVSLPPPTGRATSSQKVPPIMQTTTFEAVARIRCEDVKKCYASSDLFLNVAGPEQFIIGGGLLGFNVTIKASKAPAHQVKFSMRVPQVFIFSHAGSQQVAPQCSKRAIKGSQFINHTCDVTAMLQKDETVQFMFHMDYSTTILLQLVELQRSHNIIISSRVSSDTPDDNPNDNIRSIDIEPRVQRDITITGSSKPEQAQAFVNESLTLMQVLNTTPNNNTVNVTSLGPEISHSYSIHNSGPSPLLSLSLDVLLPLSQPFGNKTLPVLYITYPLTLDGSITCGPPTPNHLNFSLPQLHVPDASRDDDPSDDVTFTISDTNDTAEISTRRKRNALASQAEEKNTKLTETTEINCDTIKCFSMRCTVKSLPAGSSASVTVHSRLVLAAMPTNHRYLDVSTVARRLDNNETLSINTRVTVFLPPQGKLDLLSDNWWLLLAAIIGGLIVVLLLVFVLYKCGFFKRKKRQRLHELRETHRRQSMRAPLIKDDHPGVLTKEQEQLHQQNYVLEQLQNAD